VSRCGEERNQIPDDARLTSLKRQFFVFPCASMRPVLVRISRCSDIAERKPDEAIPLYQNPLEIRKGVEHSERDADFASEHANLARAYFIVGQLDEAAPHYQQAVMIFEAAILALPEMRDNYTSRLKSILLEYAKLKAARGEVDSAKTMEQQAAGLQTH
jgi:tetratricopeptide (TPR) repeat protein